MRLPANNIPSVILIPPVDRDSRIGSIFDEVFKIIFQTEQTELEANHLIEWDFTNCEFLHPFFIGVVGVLLGQYGEYVRVSNVSEDLNSYLKAVYFYSPLRIDEETDCELVWTRYRDKSYLPLCCFNPLSKSSEKAQEIIKKLVSARLGQGGKLVGVVSWLLSELIDNITEHSHGLEGYLFCQYVERENMLYILIMDNGRSIYTSFAADMRYQDNITNLESSALLMALQGKSTKNRPDAENRGYGISNSRKLVVDGLNGEFFLMSGAAFFRHDIHGEQVVDLPDNIRWNGTAVLLKIPTIIPAGFNFYNYIS